MKLLVKYHGNWADEMDVDGFFVTSVEGWNNYVERVNKHFETESHVSYYVGTNEEIFYESADDLLRDFKSEVISDEEADTLLRLFQQPSRHGPKVRYGFTGPDVE